MGLDEQRERIEFYGFRVNDWVVNFGDFTNHHDILDPEYISDASSTSDYSTATETHYFLYPYNIKKIYYIEGVIKGHITLAASGCTSTCTSYRVTLCKVDIADNHTELASTNWITPNTTLGWDAVYSAGEEIVYHFWIETDEEKKITENERLYMKIEIQGSACLVLMHSNDKTWEDVWIDIPFKMGG
jgi:hypothetical protein